MARKKQDPAIRKNEFIETATRLFVTQGYEHTSLRDILKALGGETALSPSVFYYYFKSKDELLDACLDAYIDRYADDVFSVLEDKTIDYPAIMKKVVVRINEATHDLKFILVAEKYSNNTLFHNLLAERFFNKNMPRLAKFISEGLDSGMLPMTDLAREASPMTIARLLCNGISTLFHEGTLILPSTQHNFENVRLIPAYTAYILGLPTSMFKQD